MIFSNLSTIVQANDILERQEHVSVRSNFFFSVCFMKCVPYLLIEKNFSLKIGKTLTFVRVGVCTILKLALSEQIVKFRNTLKNR